MVAGTWWWALVCKEAEVAKGCTAHSHCLFDECLLTALHSTAPHRTHHGGPAATALIDGGSGIPQWFGHHHTAGSCWHHFVERSKNAESICPTLILIVLVPEGRGALSACAQMSRTCSAAACGVVVKGREPSGTSKSCAAAAAAMRGEGWAGGRAPCTQQQLVRHGTPVTAGKR